ncbi:TetR family transcriptional regulator [Nocardioides pyridinolyticus]
MSDGAHEGDTKVRIRRIAAELFARDGYHATGMAALTDAVGLGRGALYYHIGSKEALLHAISMDAIDQLLPTARDIVEQDTSATEMVRALARALMRNIATLRAEWTVFFREYTGLSGDGRQEVMAAREDYESLWRRAVEKGMATGEFTMVEPIVVKGILGMFNYSYLWLSPNGAMSPEEVADRFTEVVLAGITAAGPGKSSPGTGS